MTNTAYCLNCATQLTQLPAQPTNLFACGGVSKDILVAAVNDVQLPPDTSNRLIEESLNIHALTEEVWASIAGHAGGPSVAVKALKSPVFIVRHLSPKAASVWRPLFDERVAPIV